MVVYASPMNKTIQIVRPASLENLSKNLIWKYDGTDIRVASKSVLRETMETCLDGGLRGPTMVGNYIKSHLLYDGSLIMVDERVSRDLEISTVVGDLSRLAWPSACMELRFSDSTLPTIVLVRMSGEKMGDKNESGVLFACDMKDGGTLTLSLPDRIWQSYVDGQYQDSMDAAMIYDEAMNDDEAQALRYMAMLAIKVVAYASVPQYAPQLLSSKAEWKNAGVHPKHVLENQKVLSVRYLPHLIRENKQSANTGEGTHKFLGRAGHIRYYESERYVNVRGQWQWLPPIPPPEGVKVIYKVRKPSK